MSCILYTNATHTDDRQTCMMSLHLLIYSFSSDLKQGLELKIHTTSTKLFEDMIRSMISWQIQKAILKQFFPSRANKIHDQVEMQVIFNSKQSNPGLFGWTTASCHILNQQHRIMNSTFTITVPLY